MKHLRPFAWLAMGSMALFLVACSESEDATNAAAPAPAKPTVSIISASKETLTPSFEVPAVIEATQTARIRAVDDPFPASFGTGGSRIIPRKNSQGDDRT